SWRSANGRRSRDEKLRKEKQTSKKTSSTKDVDSSSSKGRGDGEASGSMVGQVEPTLSLAPEAGEDFKAVTTAVQANPLVVLLDSGCLHHLMGTKEVFVDMALSGDVKHVREFNWALQTIEGRGIVALQGEAGKQLVEDKDVDDEGELSTGEESTDSDVVEVPIEKQELRRSGQSRKPPERLSFHACLPPSAFTTLLYGAEADVDLPELNLDVHADPNHRSDIAMMTVKEALAKWKGKAVKVVVECIDGVDTVDVSNVADASVEEV
ncbi:unnamed protein product, partial [Closterium sp. NIES-54]